MELQKEHNYTFVHPFDNENVIAGQDTIGLEILDQMADVDVVIVPIGGGGLISGVAFAIKQLNPNIKVYGVQASGAPSMYESIHNDKITCLDSVSTIADGIAVKAPGDITVPLIQKYADDVVTVNDLEISAAVLLGVVPGNVRAEANQVIDATGKWLKISWREFSDKVMLTAKAMAEFGIEVQDNIGVYSQNMPQCFYTDFGAYANRVVSIPMYATNSPGQIEYIINDAHIHT